MSFFKLLFLLLFATYLLVASLIAFFTVKIVGIDIGPKMTLKIILSIIAFVPLYLLVAYIISRLLSRDLRDLEERVKKLPFSLEAPKTRIREVRRLGEALQSQSKRINSLLETQRLTLYRITHDLRTPLTNIKNVLEAIKEGVISPEEEREYIDKVLKETEKINTLVEEALKGLRKVSTKTRREEVELCGFLKDTLKLWEVRLEREGVRLSFSCPEKVSVRVSPLDLAEVIHNLIDNAVKYSSSPTVRVEVKKSQAQVEIRIVNDSVNPESQLKSAYRKGSLGLYIVRELVWRNGGEVEINTFPDRTEVVLRFGVG